MTKVVIITGCSSGIGLASAKLFQSKGWKVAATMRNPACESGKELAKLSDIQVYKLDIQDTASIKPTVDAVLAKFGRVGLLINNAGYGQVGLLEATPREKMVEQFEVNVFGTADMMKAIIPYFRANEPGEDGLRGTIINISSGAGKFSLPNMSLYCASKHALEGLTEAVSYELSTQQIAVKMLDPCSGIAETKFGERALASFANDPALTSYKEFLDKFMNQLTKMTGTMTSAQVAEGIYDAATDGKDQLHYYVYEDPLELLRKKQTLREQEYIQLIRVAFSL